jgi:alcohol oxidase
LTVLDKSRVIRVIFEYGPLLYLIPSFLLVPSRNGRAVGVEYISEGNGTSSHPPSRIVVKASRLVVVSAGAFGSPAILERSGIGSKEVLDKNGIPQIVDLPGVGEHYMG